MTFELFLAAVHNTIKNMKTDIKSISWFRRNWKNTTGEKK